MDGPHERLGKEEGLSGDGEEAGNPPGSRRSPLPAAREATVGRDAAPASNCSRAGSGEAWSPGGDTSPGTRRPSIFRLEPTCAAHGFGWYPPPSAELDRSAIFFEGETSRATLGRLEGANLEGASSPATIRGLTKCSLLRADPEPRQAEVAREGDRLVARRIERDGAKFNGGDVVDLVADGLIAEDATFDEAIVEREFIPAGDLPRRRPTGAEFYECDFTGADFTGADLSNAIFARCKFTGSQPHASGKLIDANLVQSEADGRGRGRRRLPRATLGGVICAASTRPPPRRSSKRSPRRCAPRPSCWRPHLDASSVCRRRPSLTSASSKRARELTLGGGASKLSWKTTARAAIRNGAGIANA